MRLRPIPRRHLGVLCALCLAACAVQPGASPASAQNLAMLAPVQAPIDTPVPGIAQPTLSPAALRDCLQKRQAMVEIAAQPPVDPGQLQRERATIDARQAALDDEHAAIADDDAKAVDAYNAKLASLQTRINRFNDDVRANAEQAQLGEGLRQDFNAHCAGQVYYRDTVRSRNLADQP